MQRDEIYDVLREAFKKSQTESTIKHGFGPDLKLVGRDGVLDSLDAMLFLDMVDEVLSKKTGRQIVLTDGDAFTRERSPFASMNSLADYIEEILQQS